MIDTSVPTAVTGRHGTADYQDLIRRARRAGVGHATVFRRFPTKDALIAAVAEQRIAELQGMAEQALAADDAGAAFTEFCLLRCAQSPASLALRDAGVRVVERAQRSGDVRTDIDAAAVPDLIRAALRAAPPGAWRSYIQIVLDGLRPR